MGDNLGARLCCYMERQVPTIGTFIYKKQCMDLGFSPDNITPSMLAPLADRLASASRLFLGPAGNERLRHEINNGEF